MALAKEKDKKEKKTVFLVMNLFVEPEIMLVLKKKQTNSLKEFIWIRARVNV